MKECKYKIFEIRILVNWLIECFYSFLAWHNIKMSREVGDRLRLDEMQFNQAGRGPLKKTYKKKIE